MKVTIGHNVPVIQGLQVQSITNVIVLGPSFGLLQLSQTQHPHTQFLSF